MYDVSVWTGYISLWIGTPDYSCGHDNNIISYVNGDEFLPAEVLLIS